MNILENIWDHYGTWWATALFTLLYSLLLVWGMYLNLICVAKREERDMEAEFGQEYLEYKKHTSMFIPWFHSKQKSDKDLKI